MLKRVSVAWLPIALMPLVVMVVVSYWAGRRSPPQRGSDPLTTSEERVSAGTEGEKPEAGAPGAGTPGETAGWGEDSSAYQPRDTSTPPRPDNVVDPAGGFDTTTDRSLASSGPGPGGLSGRGGYGTDDEMDRGWEDDTDTATTIAQGRGYTTEYDAASGQSSSAGRGEVGSTTLPPPRGGTTSRYGTPGSTVKTAGELAYTFHLFDGFERGNSWAVESAADHAELSLSGERVSEGRRALEARFEAFGRGNFELRREVNLDLTDATTLRVDVYNETGVLDLVLGCRAGYDTTLFTTPPKPIQPGWNEDVSFSLAELSSGEAGLRGTSWNGNRDQVSRVSLIFRERDQTEGTVHIDNIRFDRPATVLGHRTRPDLRRIVASGEAIERFEPIELVVEFEADYQDFFDRAEVDCTASFFSPSGKRLEVHGFVYCIDAQTARPVWEVRFAPGEVGVWRYDVTVKSAGGDTSSGTYSFTCHRKADRRGFIRRSRQDGHYFEFDDGSFYYPLGQNVCWASNYDYFLKKIEDYGGNYVRVWLCPWNLQLEDPREPGKYDLRAANALDSLVELCERRGIYMQLVLRYHGMHQGDWAKSPYNADNGGPCTSPGEVFTDAAARDQHKRFLDYVVARWGHSTAIFAWELWNEADLARADRDSDLVAWHREMSDYLKKIDVHRHLVTTSVAGATRAPGLFELPNIDFVPVHFYSRDVFRQIYDSYVRYRELRKPVFIGEFSGGHKPADDLSDTEGVRIRAGLWLAFVTPMAGSAMPWWWDTHVDKNDLYGHWAALAKFALGIDRRGKHYEVLRSKIPVFQGEGGPDAWVSMQGLVSPSEAFLWVYDEARILRPEHAGRPLLVAERTVRLHGMLGGTFRVEIWDTREGKVLSRATASTADGELAFTLPKCSHDIAVKIVKEGEAMPRLEW